MATPTADELRAAFDAAPAFTVGLEEEVFACAPGGAFAEDADAVLARVAGDARFKPELPAGQLELVTPPCAGVEEALRELRRARRDLLAAGGVVLATGVHPTAPALGRLRTEPRYATLGDAYGDVARRQLVASLQVHVAVPGADAALATYNALRAYLPELLALSACAPFHAGRDTGLATVRPTISTQLPRQGMPPALGSWEELAAAYVSVGDAAQWWWELRPHPAFGTLEVRVCDSQPGLEDAARVARAVVSVVRRVAESGDDFAAPGWRIAENRWSAIRHGIEGEMRDLRTGAVRSTRAALEELGVEPPAVGLPERLRAVGPAGAAEWLVARYRE
jgi:glutamate---cysteine ligase / carboxylate-amine ligase